MDIYIFPFVSVNKINRVFDMSEPSLAEDVVFMKTEIFGTVHIKVSDGKTFGHHLKRRMVINGFFGNDNPSRMNGQMIGEVLDIAAEFDSEEGDAMILSSYS